MQKKHELITKYKKKYVKYNRFYDLLEIKPTHAYKKHNQKINQLKNNNINNKLSKISYMIIAHEVNTQLKLLLESLLLDYRSIVYVHIDAKINVNKNVFLSENERVIFIKNRVRVNWGGFSMVDAMKNLIREALKDIESDRFVLISGSCFPIKFPVKINDELLRSNGNLFSVWGEINPENLSAEGFGRYSVTKFQPCDVEILNPKKSIIHSRLWNIYKKISGQIPVERDVSLSDLWRGSQFFAANREVAEWFVKSHPDLDYILKWSLAPDEIYFNTLYIRYLRRSGGDFTKILPSATEQGTHYIKKTVPTDRTLRQKLFEPIDLRKLNKIDLPEVLASSCFFARKCNAEISKEIERLWRKEI